MLFTYLPLLMLPFLFPFRSLSPHHFFSFSCSPSSPLRLSINTWRRWMLQPRQVPSRILRGDSRTPRDDPRSIHLSSSRGTENLYMYTPSAIQSSKGTHRGTRRVPTISRRESSTTLGLNNVKASSCVDEHEFLSDVRWQ